MHQRCNFMSKIPPSQSSRRWQRRVTVWGAPALAELHALLMSSLPLSVMTYWPATAELDHTSEALHERNKSLLLVPRWTNPIWTTHTHYTHRNSLLLIHSCSVCSFSLIDSVDLLGSRAFLASILGKRKKLGLSESDKHLFDNEQNPTEKYSVQAAKTSHYTSKLLVL